MPGYGGPTSTYGYGSQEPTWLVNRMPMPPDTPQQPQNLLRPTYKGMSNKMSSTGKSVYALYGLGVVGANPGDGQLPDSAKTRAELEVELANTRAWCMARGFAYAAVGGFLAHAQLKKAGAKKAALFIGVLGGAIFPVVVNGGIYLWNS